MAKRFTDVKINNKYEIILSGFVGIKQLHLSDEIVEILAEYSSYEKVHFLVEHNLFLDFPGNDVDISDKELDILIEHYDYFLDEGHISTEEVAEFDVYGIGDDEFVEE